MSNKISQKKSFIFKMMAVLSIFLCAVFGISACTWFEDDATSGDSNYDANGNLRITTANVALNKPENDGSVNADTGSFVWDFEYYINSTDKKLVNQYYDQLNYDLLYNELNGITDASKIDTQKYVKIKKDDGTITYVEYDSSNSSHRKAEKYYRGKYSEANKSYSYVKVSESEDPTVKQAIVTAKNTIRSSSDKFYLLENGSYIYYDDGVYKQIYFHFPSYNVSMSGITYQIKIEVDYSKLAVVMGGNGLFQVTYDDSKGAKSHEEQLAEIFKVYYRTGTDGDWKTDYQMAKVVEFTADSSTTASTTTGTDDPYLDLGSKFKIYFNPMLNKGSTSRYIRVQSIPSEQFNSIENLTRGNSVYTSPVAFNVYKQTFKITCNNSSEYTYEGLTYDSYKYYFSTKEERSDTTFSTKLTAGVAGYTSVAMNSDTKLDTYSALTGYFVEGRVISVDRYIDTSSDYGFQAWTINGKADNSKTLACATPNVSEYPSSDDADACLNYYSINSMGIKFVNYKDNISETSTATLATETAFNIFDNIDTSSPYYEILSEGNIAVADTSLATTSEEASAVTPDYYKGSLYAVVCTDSASNVYYCNVAKVRNFILSGTTYNGEDFFVSNSAALLDDVDIYVWKGETLLAKLSKANNEISIDSLNGTELGNLFTSMGIADSDEWKANISISNGQFSIGNLAYDCSISFGKITTTTATNSANNYSFYSTTMTESTSDGIYKLCVKISDSEYSDRLGNTIIGTKYTADNKIDVNIYYEDGNSIVWAGNAQTNTSYNGIQYQVISTTQEETDVFGYTTSKVIISLLLPTNCSLTGYNAESINSISKVTYTSGDNTILCDVGYSAQSRENTFTYYYVIENELPKDEKAENKFANLEDFDSTKVSGGNTLNCLLYNGNYYQYSHKDTHNDTENTYYDYYYAYDVARTTVDGKQVVDRYIIRRSEIKDGGTTYTHFIYQNIDDEISKDTSFTSDSDKIVVSSNLTYGGNTYSFSNQSGNSKVEVVATAYKTDLVYNNQYNMYVYYNIVDYTYKNGNDNVTEYYYTAPLGIKTSTLSHISGGGLNVATTINWFQEELNGYLSENKDGKLYLSYKVYDSSIGSGTIYNMEYSTVEDFVEYECSIKKNENSKDELLLSTGRKDTGEKEYIQYGNKDSKVVSTPLIMLGTDILAGKAGLAGSKFLEATDNGKNILANHYYYIQPVGDKNTKNESYTSTELLISQYLNTDNATVTEQRNIFLCKNDQLFTNNAEKIVTDYKYAYYCVNTTQKDGGYTTTIIEYGVDDGVDDGVDGSYTKINGTEINYTHSMKNGYRTLFAYEGSDYVGYTLGGDKNFINQEQNGNILKNIVGITNNYISERFAYDVNFNNELGASDGDKKLTVLYHIYTCYKNEDKVVSTYLYYDGTSYYISTSDGNALNASPQLTKLEDGKATVDGNTIQFIANDGKIYSNDSADYTNVVSYEYYEYPSLDDNISDSIKKVKLGTRYYAALGTSANSAFSPQHYLTSKFIVKCVDSTAEYYGKIDKFEIKNDKLLINIGTDNVEYSKETYGSLYIKDESGEYKEVVESKIEDGKLLIKIGTDYVEYNGSLYIELENEIRTIEVTNSTNAVVRQAVTEQGNNVHLLGKVVLLGNAEYDIYPSFSYEMKNEDKGILHSSNGKTYYYNIDYTTINSVIQGFPGVKILSGAPYVNPIMYFEVKHKADEKAVIDIGLEITNGYYVEVIANAIDSTENNLIYDFSTVTFKDTITNLTSNDYIDRMYYALDRDTQKAVIAYVKTSNGQFEAYLGGTPLTIQNIGINDNDEYAYAITTMTESGLYIDKLYIKENDKYIELEHENLIIWESSTTALEDIPTFDAHNYYISDNGLIILTSDGQDNEICSKLEDLFISGVGSVTSAYNYDEVLIGGFTSAYRVDADEIKNSSSLQTFWKDDAINISNNYNFGDPYFLTDKEGVVLVANPIVSLKGDENGTDIIYAFKRWAIYGRYNSEILYYNKELSEERSDAQSAVMRFTSNTAGYYVFMPIYERIYSVNVGTAIKDGALNMGGSISVAYNGQSGDSIDLKNSYYGDNAQDVYFVEMLKTSSNNVTQYYYSDIEITPFLYFTGTIGTYENNGKTIYYPIFEARDDIVQVKIGSGVFYYTLDENGKIKEITKSTTLTSGTPYIVEVTPEGGGRYTFEYKLDGGETQKFTNVSYYSYFDFVQEKVGDDGEKSYVYLDGETKAGSIGDLFSFGYSANYYFDGKGNGTSKSKVVIYNQSDMHFYAIENNDFVTSNGTYKNGISDWFNTLLGYKNTEAFATLINKKFNSISLSYGDPIASINTGNTPADFVTGTFYLSKLARLSSGELYSHKETVAKTDDDGNIKTDSNGNTLTEEVDVVNATQQFKTSYFTRDTRMIISARADSGYRLYNWYLVEYNEKTKSWVKSATPLADSITASYDDIIREVYYNPYVGTNGTWYWVTGEDNRETIETTGGTYYVYYTDKNKTTQATVPSNMLDDVRGYYVEVGNGIWEPVYRKNSTSSEWYFDKSFTRPYSGDISKIQLKSHLDCIRTAISGNSARYLLGDVEVYKYNEQFYRSMDLGNMILKDNCIYIYNLHNNIRLVAEFIEVYQSYVLTEDPSEDNIQTVALYYTGTRSDKNGNTLTDVTDQVVDETDIIIKDFNYYVGANTTTPTKITGLNNEYSYTNESGSSPVAGTKYVGYSNYETLIGWENGQNELYKALDSNGQTADVDLVHMKFDVGTTIYLVVKMHYDKELTIHSLGMNNEYTLTPVLYPTSGYVNANMNAIEEERDEHYFYIFQVTFNRDLTYYYSNDGEGNYTYMTAKDGETLAGVVVESNSLTSTIDGGNYNPEYVIHVNRKKAIVSDVLNGNYTKYYYNLFDFYFNFDNKPDGVKVVLEFNDSDNVKIVGESLEKLKDYLSTVGLDTKNTNLKELLDNTYWENIKDLFIKIRDEYGVNINFAYVTANQTDTASGSKATKSDPEKLTTIDKIFKVISTKFISTDREDLKNIKNVKTAPQASGSINYINLASIPIYTYTTSIKILSNIGETVAFDEGENSMEDVFDELGVKLIQKLYTRGGYYGHTYIGIGEKEPNKSETIKINGDETTYNNIFSNDDNAIGMFDQEYALAKDTIMVLAGIGEYGTNADGKYELKESSNDYTYLKEDNGIWYVEIPLETTNSTDSEGNEQVNVTKSVKYIFTGWYEQKKISGENGSSDSWGDYQFRSNDLSKPFISTAYADTNIIALFERAVDISFESDTNSFTANFNSQTDSLGNRIGSTTSENGKKTIVSGTFTISTLLSIDITPSGGYRLNKNWSIGANNSTDITSLDNIFTFGQYDDKNVIKNKEFEELNLVETAQFNVVVGKLLGKTTEKETTSAEESSGSLENKSGLADELYDIMLTNNRANGTLSINLNLTPVKLTYILIEGYTKSANGEKQNAGYEFLLVKKNGENDNSNGDFTPLVQTFFDKDNGTVSNSITTNNKDSAQREIMLELDGNNLAIYGYFDYDVYNGKLGVYTKGDTSVTLKSWYVNEYSEATSSIDDYPKYGGSLSGYDTYNYSFNIWYYYDDKNFSDDYPSEDEQDEQNKRPDDETIDKLIKKLNGTYFHLNENNEVYFSKAKIEAKSEMQVSYATIDTLNELNSTIALDSKHISKGTEEGGKIVNSKGSISWTGAYFASENATDYIANGQMSLYGENPTKYYFHGNTKVTLTNNEQFYDNGDKSYKFIGWFEYANNKLSLVSETVTYETTAGGHYVAIFAKYAKITDAYTETVNVENSKNLNGTIQIESDDNNNIITKKGKEEINLEVYGTREKDGKNIMYVLVGGTISINVDADKNYLVSDLIVKVGDKETSIIGEQKDVSPISVSYSADDKDFEIVAKLSRGYSVNIIQLYYDSIAMSNTAIKISDKTLFSIQKMNNGKYATLSAYSLYTFTTGTKIKISFDLSTNQKNYNLGLIAYYKNGEKQTYSSTTENKPTIELTIDGDITLEIRVTKYVIANVKAYSQQNGNSSASLSTSGLVGASYADQYTGDTITVDNKGLKNGFDVLNGTILTLTASTSSTTYTFIEWRKNINSEEVVLSSDSTYNYAVEYPYESSNVVNKIRNNVNVQGIFQKSQKVTIKKEIGQIHIDDKIYQNEDGTYQDKLWSILDVKVNYIDASKNENTTILGGIQSKDFNVKADSTITLSLNINKSHENMYSAKLTIDGNERGVSGGNGEWKIENINQDSKITITFYAKRNITLVRQLNNVENTTESLDFAFGIDSNTIESNPSLNALGASAKRTWSDVQYKGNDVFVKAKECSGYSFAGFSINGQFVGKGTAKGDDYYFAIDYTKAGHDNLSIDESGTIPTLYTTDSDLVIVAMWYQTNNLNIKVSIDGDDILSNEKLYSSLNDKLNVNLVGNLLTLNESNNTYNTTLQATQIDNTNYNKLYYLYNSNLALIASNYAGYQFVGFFYSTDGSNYTKLDFNRRTDKDNDIYNYGDTLVSLLELEENKTYTIEAKYLTAWQVSTQISVTGDDKGASYTKSHNFYQVYEDNDGKWQIVNAKNGYDVYSGDNEKNNNYSRNYFYPAYSKYIAVSMDVAEFMDSERQNYTTATPIGYYINGKYVDSYVDSNAIEKTENLILGNSDKIYIVIDLTKVEGFNVKDDKLVKSDETGLFGFNNMVIERKFVQNVDYVVRIGVNNTGDINKIDQDDLNNVEITITYDNPYSTDNTSKTLTLKNNENGYWNEGNNSLYYKLTIPIGTTVTTTINGNKIGDYEFNGWYVYSNYSVAGSTSVINYTNKVEFVLTENTDIIAQYWKTKPPRTTDTQFSYKFNGEAFVDNNGFYSPATQDSETDASTIAKGLTNLLKNVAYNQDYKKYINGEGNESIFSATIEGLGGEDIIISSEDGIIFEVTRRTRNTEEETHKFMFMGWYQEIKDNKNPSTYLFVTKNLGLGYADGDDAMPAQMQNASNMTAIFSQVVEIKLNFAKDADEQLIEDSNSINYSSLLQKYSKFAPTLLDYKTMGASLYTAIEADGTLVWYTLYDSTFSFMYTLANGYHNNNISISDKNSTGNFGPINALEDVEQPAMEYIISKSPNSTDDTIKAIHKTDYSYKFESEDQKINNVTPTPKCKIEGTTHNEKPEKTASTSATSLMDGTKDKQQTSTFATSLALVGEAEGNVCATTLSACSLDDSLVTAAICNNSQSTNKSAVSLMGLDLDYEDTSTIISYIGAMVKGQKLSFDQIELTITIKFPDGTIKYLKINNDTGSGSDDYKTNYLYETDADGNIKTDEDGKNILTELPIGTTIALTITNGDTTRVLDFVKIYCFGNKDDFLGFDSNEDFDGDCIELKTTTQNGKNDETSASASFEISNANKNAINGKYLLFVINYKNIYNLELEENKISQGTVTIEYNNDNDSEFCIYETTISAVDDFAFDDINIKFEQGDDTTLKEILLQFLDSPDTSYSLETSENNFINLKDLLDALKGEFDIKDNTTSSEGALATSDKYSLSWVNDGSNGHFVITYKYNGNKLFTIAIEPDFSETDALNRQYISSITLTFELLTNMKIITQYLHIATVETNYAIEKFNPNADSKNGENYISTENNETTYTLFVYDYEFGIEKDGKYAFINYLDELYNGEIDNLKENLDNNIWSFVGYYYSGEILKTSSGDAHTKQVKPVVNGEFISDNIIIEAIYTENLSSTLGYEIDYFNNEIEYGTSTDNPNLLNTPTNNLKFKNNGNDIAFTEGKPTTTISTGLHQTSDIIIEDSERYFSFSYWLVKYNGKYLANKIDNTYEYYKIDSSAICIGSNLYIELINQLKKSKDWDFGSATTYCKYNESDDESDDESDIDLSKFEIVAYLTEEVVEIDINYEKPGEQFKITFKGGGGSNFGAYDWTTTIDETTNREYYPAKNGEADWKAKDSLINTTTWLYSDGNTSSQFKIDDDEYINFLIRQEETTNKDGVSYQRLRLVYSKYWSTKNVNINIIATSYTDRSSAALARAESGIVVREILNENNEYSNSTYLKLNGFKDMLGNISVADIDGKYNALALTTNGNANHTASYWIDTTPLYLIEFGMAVYGQTSSDENGDIELTIKDKDGTVTLSYDTLLDAGDQYAGWSLLFEEGTYVTINVTNTGNFEWADNPDDDKPNYRGLAISHNKTMSDIYTTFKGYYQYDKASGEILTSGTKLSEITQAHKKHWQEALKITSEDGQNDFYKPLNQYSDFYIKKDATSYSFIANQNASFIADYIGIFTTQNQYISAVLGSDGSIKYTNNNTNQKSYTGENFIFIVAPKGTQISLDRTEVERYTEVENATIIKDSSGNIVKADEIINNPDKKNADKKDEEEAEDSSTSEKSRSIQDELIYRDDENDETSGSQENNSSTTVSGLHKKTGSTTQMVFYSQAYHLSLGTVSNRYVSGSISVLYNYVTYNKQILKELSKQSSKQFEYNLLNPTYNSKDDETGESASKTSDEAETGDESKESSTAGNIPKAYIINDADYSKLKNNNLKEENLTTSISVKKSDKIILLAEEFSGYSFVGFKLVSQSNEFTPISETQGLQSKGSIYTTRDVAKWNRDTVQINGKTYYKQTITGLDGNIQVVALYQPKVYVLNITHKAFDITNALNRVNENGVFEPNPTSDDDTTYGKITSQSLIVASGDVIELKISTKGFAEYKGITTKDNSSYNAIYSTLGSINNKDYSTISSGNISGNDALWNAIGVTTNNSTADSTTNPPYEEKWTTNHSTKVYHYSTTENKDITEGVTYGTIGRDRLFTSEYSTKIDSNFAQNQNAVSYLYLNLNEVNQDIYLYAYFASLYYTMNISIGEKQSARNGEGSKTQLEHSAYVAYSREYQEHMGNWVNPSADSKTGFEYGIAESDPYVYTFCDSKGTLLANPARVTENMLSSAGVGIIEGEDNTILPLTLSDGQTIYTRVKKVNGKTVLDEKSTITRSFDGTHSTCTTDYATTELKNLYNYLEITDGHYKFKSGLFAITIADGSPIDSGKLQINITPVENKEDNTIKIPNIKVAELALLDVIINLKTSSIKIVLRVFADSNSGFPSIGVGQAGNKTGDEEQSETVSMSSARVIGESSTEPVNTSFGGYYFVDAYNIDENGNFVLDTEKYPNGLSLDAEIIFQIFAKKVTATLNFGTLGTQYYNYGLQDGQSSNSSNIINGKGELIIDLTNVSENDHRNALDALNKGYHSVTTADASDFPTSLPDGWHYCDEHSQGLNCVNGADKCSMIDYYKMYIIKNAYAYINALGNAVTNGNISYSYFAKFCSALLSFNPATQADAGDLPMYGNVFDYISFNKYELQEVLIACGYGDLAQKLECSEDLTFRQLDIYGNFQKEISSSLYMDNCVLYGDMITTCVQLTEHTAPHMIQYDRFGGVWAEDPGYTYINSATADWVFEQNGAAGIQGVGGTTYYTENTTNNFYSYQKSDITQKETTTLQKVISWLAGISDKGAKYKDTYTKCIYSGLVPSANDYIGSKSTAFTNVINICLSPNKINVNNDDFVCSDGRIVTARVEKVHSNLLSYILTTAARIFINAAAIGFVAVTGGIGGAVIAAILGIYNAYVTITDGIALLEGVDSAERDPLYTVIDNLDFGFD